MPRKVLHFLLTAMIVACPFLCRSGVCSSTGECCAPEYNAQACCDEHSHNEHSDHHPASPGGYCQCICGGAVIEYSDDDVTQQMDYPLHDVVVTSDLMADVPFRQKFCTALAHDGKFSPGRFLCVLHMTFLL